MQTPHPTADVPAYKQSLWKTRIESGCEIHSGQRCLSPHLPPSCLPATMIFCHSRAVCLPDWNTFLRSYHQKRLEEKLCSKSEGFTWQQTRPHAGAATSWVGAGSAKEGSAQTLHVGGSCLHKAAAVLAMGHRNTPASNGIKPSGARRSFCTILENTNHIPPQITETQSRRQLAATSHIFNKREKLL